MTETIKAKKAFEDYYNMGPGRSIVKLHAEYMKLPAEEAPTRRLQTVRNWSAKYGWQDRVARRDAEIALAQFEVLKQQATQTGYAVYQMRIQSLNDLAQKLFGELEDEKYWYTQTRIKGKGENKTIIQTEMLNEPLIRQFRGLLDDIAKEMGERIQGIAIAGAIAIEDMEEIRKRRWAMAAPALQAALMEEND